MPFGGGGGGGGVAHLTAPPPQFPAASGAAGSAGGLSSGLAQLNLMSMVYGASLQLAVPPPTAPPTAPDHSMCALGLDLSMPGGALPYRCSPCAVGGAAIAPAFPVPAVPTPAAAYPLVQQPAAQPPVSQPRVAPVGAGGLRALLIPRSTARVFLQLCADNTARNIETCVRS